MRLVSDTESADEFLRRLGKRLRELRKARHWSATELSDRLQSEGFQMHSTTLTKMETGDSRPQLDLLFALARVYEFPSVADLMDPQLEDLHWLQDSELLLSIRRLRDALGDDEAQMVLREILSGVELNTPRDDSPDE